MEAPRPQISLDAQGVVDAAFGPATPSSPVDIVSIELPSNKLRRVYELSIDHPNGPDVDDLVAHLAEIGLTVTLQALDLLERSAAAEEEAPVDKVDPRTPGRGAFWVGDEPLP